MLQNAKLQNAEYFFNSTVRPTAEEFINDKDNIRLGRLAAIVLYHMSDYWFLAVPDKSYKDLPAYRKSLIQECPDFLIIRDVADATKHAQLSDSTSIPRELTKSENVTRPPGIFQASFGDGVFAEASPLTAKHDNSKEQNLAEAARSVLIMWEGKLKTAISTPPA